jgi:hypothetical protein
VITPLAEILAEHLAQGEAGMFVQLNHAAIRLSLCIFANRFIAGISINENFISMRTSQAIRWTPLIMVFGTLFLSTVLGSNAFGQSSKMQPLIFTGIADPENLGNYPIGHKSVILVHYSGTWHLVNMPEEYVNTSWVFAGRAKGKPSVVWGIAEWDVGDQGPDLEIARSTNGGRSWRHLYSLKKMSRHGTLVSFNITSNGIGSLTMQLENSIDPDHQGGFYTYSTRNGGRSWTRIPVYSASAPPVTDVSIDAIDLGSGIRCVE